MDTNWWHFLQPCVKYTLAKSSCCCFSSSSTGIPRFSKRWDLRLFLATALLYSLRALVPSLTMVPNPRFSRAVKACSGAIVLLLCFFSQISLASEDRRWINWVAHCVLKTKKNFPYTAYSILEVCLSRSRDYLPQLITAILESVINILLKLDSRYCGWKLRYPGAQRLSHEMVVDSILGLF